MVVYPGSKHFASVGVTLACLAGGVKGEIGSRAWEEGEKKDARQSRRGLGKLDIPRFSCDVKVEFVVIPITMIKFSTDKTTIDTFYGYFFTDD